MIARFKGTTLIELLVSLVFLSIIALGLGNIDIFSLFHVVTSSRRAKVQNDVSLALGHMSKEISKAIGNEKVDGLNQVLDTSAIAGDPAITVYVDSGTQNPNGTYQPGNGQRGTVTDRWIAYRYRRTGAASEINQLWYCPQCTNSPCISCNPAWSQQDNLLVKNITDFTITKPTDILGYLNNNYITIKLQACFDSRNTNIPDPCDTPTNPSANMTVRIKMPAVSVN